MWSLLRCSVLVNDCAELGWPCTAASKERDPFLQDSATNHKL